LTNPNSLRQKVFAKKKENNNLTLQDFYKFFKTSNRNSIKTYYGQANKLHPSNISENISNKKPKKSHNISPQPASLDLTKASPERLLMLGMTKQIELDPSLFRLYIDMGLYRRDQEKLQQEYYTFREPEWFVPHQQEMFNYFMRGNVFVQGIRQLTYKTTTALIAAYAKGLIHKGLYIVQISTSKDLSKELLGKIVSDPRVNNIWKPKLKIALRESYTLQNSSKLLLRPCKATSLQGLTGGLWIDEIDKIIKQRETREALAAALPIVITLLRDNIGFIWITCNQAVGEGALQFEYFKRELMKFGNMFPVCDILEPSEDNPTRQLVQLNDFDVPVPIDPLENEQFWKEMIYRLQIALADEEFAKAQMLNIYEDISGMFKGKFITRAFESWAENLIPEFPTNVVMGIDPGHTHATGVIILALDNRGHVHEIYAKEFFGSQISEEKFKDLVHGLYREYGVRTGYCESNSGGLWWMDHWRLEGLTFWAANFGVANPNTGDVSNMQKAFERTYHERVLKHLLEKGKIHLHNQQLFKEFSLYNPTESKEKGKGDLVDALLHATFHIVGGMNYIMEIMKERAEIIEPDAVAL